jgi:hypothetical protein
MRDAKLFVAEPVLVPQAERAWVAHSVRPCDAPSRVAGAMADEDAMARELSMRELDQRLAEIKSETSRRLSLVPKPTRAGDWPALIHQHREMLAILETARKRKGELTPPADRAEHYWSYLAAVDRQLRMERAVLQAAETRDFDAYSEERRLLVAAVGDVAFVGRRAGLRSTQLTWAQRQRLYMTMPIFVIRALWRARGEARAGRRWQSS